MRSTVGVGEPVRLVVTASWKPSYDLRVFAVAPRKNWFEVVGAITGDVPDSLALVPRDGFRVRLVRVGPNRWRGTVKFPRAGRWQLVEPCGCKSGISTRQATAFVLVR